MCLGVCGGAKVHDGENLGLANGHSLKNGRKEIISSITLLIVRAEEEGRRISPSSGRRSSLAVAIYSCQGMESLLNMRRMVSL